jgi:hypothetical protein
VSKKMIGIAALVLAAAGCAAGIVSASYYSSLHWYDWGFRPAPFGGGFIGRLIGDPFFVAGAALLVVGVALLVSARRRPGAGDTAIGR